MINMKRGPVRESLIQLHCEGILTRLPHAGFTVRKLDYNDVRDLYEMREAVESRAASLAAARWSPLKLKPIQDSYAALESLHKNKNLNMDKIQYCDEMFHRSILRASGNQAFERVFRYLHFYSILSLHFHSMCLITKKTSKTPSTSRAKKVLSEHRNILNAIENRDDIESERLMKEHIKLSKKSILSKIQSEENAFGNLF
jgi:DNA-binding GntR family transcriptional regulator